MNQFAVLFALLRLYAPFAVVLIGGVLELVLILHFKKQNGAVLWRRLPVPAAPVIWHAVIVGFFGTITLALSGDIGFIGSAVFVAFTIPHAAALVRSIYLGVYQSRIIGEEFIAEWSEVESAIFSDEYVRFVHKDRGAMEFPIPRSLHSRIREFVNRKSAIVVRDEAAADIPKRFSGTIGAPDTPS